VFILSKKCINTIKNPKKVFITTGVIPQNVSPEYGEIL
jgi:hypothetical protein